MVESPRERHAMPKPVYPRKSVLEHRERIADGAVEALARGVRERESVEREKAQAEADRIRTLTAAEELRENERAALARGELKASDLAQKGAWEMRAEAEARAMDLRVAETEKKLHDAVRAEAVALTVVANKKADADVLVKDRERFHAEAQKRADASEEEAAVEAYRPIKG